MNIIGLIKNILSALPFKEIFGPLVGAWFGAKMAFKYDRNLKNEEKIANEIELARYVQFVLISHIHIVNNMWNQYLKEQEKHTHRHLVLKRCDFQPSPLLNFESLSFLSDNTWPDILYQLFIHEREFLNFVDSLNKRNEFYDANRKTLQSDKDNDRFIKDLTDIIYKSYSRIDESNLKFFPRFRKYIIKKYPHENFLEIIEPQLDLVNG